MSFRPSLRLGLAAFAVLLSATVSVQAGHEMKEVKETVPQAGPFDQGRHEFQLGAGAFFSIANKGEERPAMNDADIAARLGWMLNTPSGEGVFRGNFEFLTEVFGAGIFEGPGAVIGGVTLLLRYNFVQPGAKLVPYFQIGAGGAYSDAHDETPQRRIGSAFSFNLQGGLGLRFLCSDACALFIEGDYRHLSNAGIAERNVGLNSLGGYVGASYFF